MSKKKGKIAVCGKSSGPIFIDWRREYERYWIKVYGLDGTSRPMTFSDWAGK